MSTTGSWSADAFVTAANPAPGRDIVFEYLVKSGTGFSASLGTRGDGGVGLNVYLAGGTGAGGAVPVTFGSGTISVSATLSNPPSSSSGTSVPFSTSTVILVPSSPGRLGLSVFNDSDDVLYIRLGDSASLSLYTLKLYINGLYEVPDPVYNGIVTAVWPPTVTTGSVQVTEVS